MVVLTWLAVSRFGGWFRSEAPEFVPARLPRFENTSWLNRGTFAPESLDGHPAVVVLWSDTQSGALEILLKAIVRLEEPWQRLLLSEIPEGSALRAALEEAERTDRLRLVRRPDTLCPCFDVAADPMGFARLMQKQSLKRNAAHLRRLGSLTIEHLDDEASIVREFPTFFRQHVERWAFTRTPSLFLDPAARSLYASVFGDEPTAEPFRDTTGDEGIADDK